MTNDKMANSRKILIVEDEPLIGGSGLAAARKIRENADMPIVFCTAYAEEAGLAEQMLAVRHAALIPKPVSRAKLEQAFTQLFAGD
jgi:CheY-like chemotaxis protein